MGQSGQNKNQEEKETASVSEIDINDEVNTKAIDLGIDNVQEKCPDLVYNCVKSD